MLIDAHVHYMDEEGYLEYLMAEVDRLGIDLICLSGLGRIFGHKGNDDVRRAMERYPDRIVGFGYVRPGWDKPEYVTELKQAGFRGIKITCPVKNYDDEEYYPIYHLAEEYGMPVLFHTGIVTSPYTLPEDRVSSARMRPVYLDTIAKAFPRLNIICAHIGMPWYEEACETARLNCNVYVDISGSPKGYRSHKPPSFFADVLWWEGAFGKVIFGTDVHYSDMAASLQYDRRLYETLGVSEEIQQGIFGGTMARLLGIE